MPAPRTATCGMRCEAARHTGTPSVAAPAAQVNRRRRVVTGVVADIMIP